MEMASQSIITRDNQSINDNRSTMKSQMGESQYRKESKGYHSTLIAEGTKKLSPKTLARNMSKDSLQRFEYQK